MNSMAVLPLPSVKAIWSLSEDTIWSNLRPFFPGQPVIVEFGPYAVSAKLRDSVARMVTVPAASSTT